MKKRLLIPLLILLLASASAIGQNATVHFGYDAEGNRNSRYLTVSKMETPGLPTDSLESALYLGEANDLLGRVSLYPNPTRGKLTVMLKDLDGETISVRVVSLTGSVIEQSAMTDGSHVFNLAGLLPGVYLLQLSKYDASQTWRIIKK